MSSYNEEVEEIRINSGRGKSDKVDGCNFCDRHLYDTKSYDVLVVSGNTLQVRFCKECVRDLRNQTKGF